MDQTANQSVDNLPIPNTPFDPLVPSLQVALVIFFISCYCFFLLFVLAQLSLTCYVRNKVLSYHTSFLMLGLLWGLLRLTLFSLLLSQEIRNPLLDWPLRCGPVILNFVMLALFTLCFVQLLIDAARGATLVGRRSDVAAKSKRKAYVAFSILLLAFLSVNILSFIHQMLQNSRLSGIIQLTIQEGCMILSCIVLSATLYFVSTGGTFVRGTIEREGKTLREVVVTGATLVTLYLTHSIYCIYCIVTSSDQEDHREVYVNDLVLNDALSKDYFAPISIFLICWDFLPVILMLNFFKTSPASRGCEGESDDEGTVSEESTLLDASYQLSYHTSYGSTNDGSDWNTYDETQYMSPIEKRLEAYISGEALSY